MIDLPHWWKLWSVRLAAVAGALSAVLAAEPAILLGLVNLLPNGPARWVVAGAIGLLVFGVPTIARLAAQPELKDRR